MILWDSLKLSRGIEIIPNRTHRRNVEKILKALDSGALDPSELLLVSQYDLTVKRARGEIMSAVRGMAKALNLRKPEKVANETSSTYMFSVAVYHALRNILNQHGLRFAIEPNLQNTYFIGAYDYAIVDSNDRAILIAEVKRLQSLRNIGEYMNQFRIKLRRTLDKLETTYIKHIAIHIHVTPDLGEKCEDIDDLLESIGLILAEIKHPVLLITSRGIRSRSDTVSRFQKDLDRYMSSIVTFRK